MADGATYRTVVEPVVIGPPSNVGDPLRQSPGFVSHAAEITPDGVTVTEVWETCEQWEQWVDTSVRLRLPAGAPEPEAIELHNALGR